MARRMSSYDAEEFMFARKPGVQLLTERLKAAGHQPRKKSEKIGRRKARNVNATPR